MTAGLSTAFQAFFPVQHYENFTLVLFTLLVSRSVSCGRLSLFILGSF